MKEPNIVLNLSDLESKRRLMSKIGGLQGLWEVSLKQRKRTRTLNQNAYYWAAYVTPFTEWIKEAEGDPSITTEQAHLALKSAVLGSKTVMNKTTGEAIELPPPTHNMETDEFSIYLDSAAKWLAEFCGIVVLPSEMFFDNDKPVR